MALGGFLVRARMLCSRVFGGVYQGACLSKFRYGLVSAFFSLDIPGLYWAGRVVQGVGFAYILVSAVAQDAQTHGEMLACCKPHDQKACGFVRDLVG